LADNLILLRGGGANPNKDIADSLRTLADMVEGKDNPVASYGLVLAYEDGTIGLEYGGRGLTTLLGGAVGLMNRIEREL